MRPRAALPLALLALAAGCGSDSDTAKKEPAPSAPPADTTAAKPGGEKPKPYREQVADCVDQVGFTTRDAGNALRVESPGGDLIANIQTFPTAAEAEKFNAAVEVDHAGGGKGVAVWLADAEDAEKRVVADCLKP